MPTPDESSEPDSAKRSLGQRYKARQGQETGGDRAETKLEVNRAGSGSRALGQAEDLLKHS